MQRIHWADVSILGRSADPIAEMHKDPVAHVDLQ